MSQNAYIKEEIAVLQQSVASRKPENAPAKTVAVATFLDWLKARKYSQATIKSRGNALSRFISFLDDQGVERFQDVTPELLNSYRTLLVDCGLMQATMECYLWGVRIFFDWLANTGVIFENPGRFEKIRKTPLPLPQVISIDEVHRLLNSPDCSTPLGLRDRAMFEVLYATGVRREELLALTVFDLDLDGETLRVIGKGRKERVLPLGGHAAHCVKQYLQHARPKLLGKAECRIDALWLNRMHRPLGGSGLAIQLQAHARAAGIRKQVSPHTLRRSCATHMLQNGAHPLAVAAMLGHSSLATLTHYLRLNIKDLKQMHRKTRPGR